MRNISDKEQKKLSAEIAGLESLDLNQLRAQWKLLYEIEAPPHLSRDWLRRAVAYRIQENVLGGLKPAEIARREGLAKRYVTRLTKLAFVSPAFAEAIAEGEVSPETNLQMLMDGRIALPLGWND